MENRLGEAMDFLDIVTSDGDTKAEVFGVSDYEKLRQEGYDINSEQSAQCDVILAVKSALDAAGLPQEHIPRWFGSMPKGLQDEGTPLELLAECASDARELILAALPTQN